MYIIHVYLQLAVKLVAYLPHKTCEGKKLTTETAASGTVIDLAVSNQAA